VGEEKGKRIQAGPRNNSAAGSAAKLSERHEVWYVTKAKDAALSPAQL